MRALHRFSLGPMHQRGSGLIEVLIAVLIMGIGLLGIAAMQATALRNSQSALDQSQAVIQTYAILDAMRANRDNALTGAYNQAAMVCDPPVGDTTLAQKDIRSWITSLEATLGGGANTCGRVSCVAGVCTVSVQWDDSRAAQDVAGGQQGAGLATRTVTTRTTL